MKYMIYDRGVQRWARESREASNKAREHAVSKLLSETDPVPNGTFVLRDSSSRPGHYGKFCIETVARIHQYWLVRLSNIFIAYLIVSQCTVVCVTLFLLSF